MKLTSARGGNVGPQRICFVLFRLRLTVALFRALHFDVPHAFILQQAAWLYERHLSHVRAQLRRPTPTTASNIASPSQGAVSGSGSAIVVGGVSMKRLGSGGSRAPSAMSLRARDSPVPKAEGSIPGTPRAPVLSRNPSTATVTQSRQVQERAAERSGGAPSPRQPPQRSFRSSFPPPRKQESPAPGSTDTAQRRLSNITAVNTTASPVESPPASPESSESSSSDEESPAGPPGIRRSQIFRRGPHFKAKKPALDTVTDYSQQDEDEDDEDEQFLPFAAAAAKASGPDKARTPSSKASGKQRQDAISKSNEKTERPSPEGPSRQSSKGIKGKAPLTDANTQVTSPTESASSASSVPQNDGPAPIDKRSQSANARRALGQLSPHHRAELARLSPRRTKTGESQGQGSEGTPSMGSSFSDLDGSWVFINSQCRRSYSLFGV